MSFEDYLEKKKNLYHKILKFIDDETGFNDNFKELTDIFIDQSIIQSKEDLSTLFHLIQNLSNYHFRTTDFFTRIEKILTFFHSEIQQFYSNHEIFNIFKNNKRILLFLIEENLFNFDQSIVQIITNGFYKQAKYPFFFYREIKPFLTEKNLEDIESRKSEMIDVESDEFENNRKKAENHRHICQLIKKDSIDDFIIYLNNNNISL